MPSQFVSSWSWTRSKPSSRQGQHLAILLAAQARGWELYYAEQRHLYLRDGTAMAHLAKLRVFEDLRVWFTREAASVAKLGDFESFSCARIRRSTPNSSTHYIWTAPRSGPWYATARRAARHERKSLYAWFPECCAPTLISRDMHDMANSCASTARWSASAPQHGRRSIFVLDQATRTATWCSRR